jgi:predicted DNA binding CopG/RHH family protein
MKKNNLSVNKLTNEDFDEIMAAVNKKKKVAVVKSEQINMRLSPDVIEVAKKLAKRAGKPTTTFLSDLLKEDLLRIWKLIR